MKLTLRSFTADCPFNTEVELQIERSFINCRFIIIGQINLLKDLPELSTSAGFRDGLWKATCFELFVDQNETYTEWNVARDQSWACYQFEGYRKKNHDVKDKEPYDFKLVEGIGELRYQFKLPYHKPIKALSPCCVLKVESDCYYLSSKHIGTKPDFHLRESFISL